MRISKIEFKNILSFGGDIENSIELDESGSLSQISGENGLGKSNIVRLLEIGLYYKYPSLVSNIINDLSDAGYIKIHVFNNGNSYVVDNIFKSKKLHSIIVHKNGVLQDWGNISKASSLVLAEIATIPYSIFSNILSTSIDSSSSLLKLTAKDGRDIVNNVFDLSEVNIVNDKFVSPEFTLANTNHTKSINDIDATEKIIVSTNESINEIKELDKEINATKKETLDQSLLDLTEEKGTLETNISTDADMITGIEAEIKFASYSKDQDTLSLLNQDLVKSTEKLGNIDADILRLKNVESSRYMDKAIKTNKTNTDELETLKAKFKTDGEKKVELQTVIDTKNTRIEDLREFWDFRESMIAVNANRKKLLDLSPRLLANKEKVDSLGKEIEKVNESIAKDNESVAGLKIKLDFYKKGKCAICDVDFTSDGYPAIIKGIEESISNYSIENNAYVTKRRGFETQVRETNADTLKINEEKTEIITAIKSTSKKLPKLVTDELVLDFNNDIDLEIFEKYDWKDDLVKISNEIDETTKELDALDIIIGITDKSIKATEKAITDLVFEAKVKFGIDMSTYVPVDGEVNTSTDEELKAEKDKAIKDKATVEGEISTQNVSIKVIENKWLDVSEELKSRYELKTNLPLDIADCESRLKERQEVKKVSDDRLIIVVSELEKVIKDIKDLEDEKDSDHISVLKANLEKTNKALATQKNASIVTKNEMESMVFLKQMYNSGGLKNALVGKVIGDINATINNIMISADIPVSVSYNEEFIPSFTKFGDLILYDQLSVGQRKMLEVISIIAIVTYYKKSFPSINFLYIDEALSSLSDSNTHKMLSSIVEWVVLKLGINVFLTSHAHIANSILNKSIKLEVKNGYTVMSQN